MSLTIYNKSLYHLKYDNSFNLFNSIVNYINDVL